MDREEHARNIKRSNSAWLRHGDRTLLGLVKASVEYGKEDSPPVFFFRYLRNIKMQTCEAGAIASCFTTTPA
jgi:hypothetical protein